MKYDVALVGCSTIAAEMKQCCRELGLPVRLYATRPVCLFGETGERLKELVVQAKTESGALLLALGRCCGEAGVEGAAAVSAARCTEMLLGSGTYSWLVEHGSLALPPPFFSTWLDHPEARTGVEEVLTAGPAAQNLQTIAAIDEAGRSPDPRGIQEIERIAGRPSRRLFTGLGHLRENLRGVAEVAGLSVAQFTPEPVAATALGPGDDCLAVGDDEEAALRSAAGIVAGSLARGTQCVWVAGGVSPSQVADDLAQALPNVGALLESGDLQIIASERLLAESNAADDPQLLVAYWVSRAADALAAGRSGLCLIHGSGWAEAAGLSSDYALAYTSRLSSACSKWPIFSVSGYAPTTSEPSLLEEMARTHPLIWESGAIQMSPHFLRSDEYLGHEDLLAALGRERIEFTCAEAQPLISALADGELNGPASVALTHHVQECPACGEMLRQHRETKQNLTTLRQSIEGIADDLWARISRELRSEE